MPLEISALTQITDDDVAALRHLIPQLSSSSPGPTREELAAIVASSATRVLVARDGGAAGRIVGTLTLALFRIPTGLRAWIEDVVVDSSARGRGVGEALTHAALAAARAAGATTVELTSRPNREAANRLYQRLGFELRNTNVYRYDLEREKKDGKKRG